MLRKPLATAAKIAIPLARSMLLPPRHVGGDAGASSQSSVGIASQGVIGDREEKEDEEEDEEEEEEGMPPPAAPISTRRSSPPQPGVRLRRLSFQDEEDLIELN